jgi:hypothetical protein
MQSPPTSAAAPSAAKAVNAKSSRAVSTPAPSSHVADDEAAAALSAAIERRSARKSSATFPTPLREAVGKSIASAIAYGIAQLLPQAPAASRLSAPQSPPKRPEVYEGVEAYNEQTAQRSSKKSPAAATAAAAAAAAPPSTTKAAGLKNMKMPGLLKEAKKRGLSQQRIDEITAPPYQGASHFTPQKAAQLKAYLLAH